MTITLVELRDKLKHVDETSLLEVLEISSEDIVERFADLIEERYEILVAEFEDETEAEDR